MEASFFVYVNNLNSDTNCIKRVGGLTLEAPSFKILLRVLKVN